MPAVAALLGGWSGPRRKVRFARLIQRPGRAFWQHLWAENRSELTIASYLESSRQAEAFLAGPAA